MRTTLLLVLVAACGDNHNNTPIDAPMHDTRPADAPNPVPRAVIVAPSAMFGMPPGIMSTLDVPTLTVDKNVGAALVGSDPVLRYYGGKLLVVNRGDANITILDGGTLMFEEQIGTGVGTNPQDVAVVGNKLYVPASGTAGVVVLTRGSTQTSTIDLSTAVGDPDGDPDCISAYAVGTNVFVACDDLDATNNLTPRGPGRIAVIDTTNDTVTTTISMPANNPQSMFQRSPMDSVFGGDLLIPTEPNFGDLTQGCLTRVSVGASPAATCAIQNSATNGSETHIDIQVDGAAETLWLAVSVDFTPTSNLQTFDLKAGTLGASAVSSSNEVISDVAVCPDNSIVVTDTTKPGGGLRVFNGTTRAEKTTTTLDIGLAPGFGNGLVCFDHWSRPPRAIFSG